MMPPRLLRLLPLVLALPLLAAATGCVLDRTAERAFLRGDTGTALEVLEARAMRANGDLALEENLRGTVALVGGDYETARNSLITAGRIMGSFPETGAREVAAIIASESARLYLGDPYEAALNSLYTAIALLYEGDEQNARAALKSGILADSDSEGDEYKSDATALYLLEALLSLRAGVLDVARRDIEQVRLLDPDNRFASESYLRSVNTIIFVDWGIGPRKVAAGRYGERAEFRLPHFPEAGVRLRLDGHPLGRAMDGIDVDFQARTRGGRPMDYILRGKAVLKGTTEVAGHVILDEALRRDDRRLAALGATLIGLSLLIHPRADTRHWHLLPAHVGIWMGRVPPGLHSLDLDFVDRSGTSLDAYRQIWHHLPFDGRRLNVYYFRSGYQKGFRRPDRSGNNHAGNHRENPS